jgi:uncharacterized protein YjlB
MPMLEDAKKIAEKVTGWSRPQRSALSGLIRERKARAFRFKDDGIIPNHPECPLSFIAARSNFRMTLTRRLYSNSASKDFLVIGAYPPSGKYDECTSSEDHKRALTTIPKVGRPRKDPVYGTKGPLFRAWPSKR